MVSYSAWLMPIQAPPVIWPWTSAGLTMRPTSYADRIESTVTMPVSVSTSTSATVHA